MRALRRALFGAVLSTVAVGSACSTPPKAVQRPRPGPPWTLGSDRVGAVPQRCPRPHALPKCADPLASDAVTRLDAQLVDHVGRGITIAGTVRALGTLCTDKACVRACCNRCDTPLGLYNRADRVALIVAECSGDECLECCTLPVVNQRIRASGVLTGYSPIGELDLAEAVASTPPGPDRLAEVFARAGGDNPSGSGETFTFMLRLQDVCVEP